MRTLATVVAFGGAGLLATGAVLLVRGIGLDPRRRRGLVGVVLVVALIAVAGGAGYAQFAVTTSASIDVGTASSFLPIDAPSCRWTGGQEVTLNWDDDPDATSYDVLRSESPNSGFASIHNVDENTTTYADSSVNPDPRPVGTYYYKIRINTAGPAKTSLAANSTECAGYMDTWAGGLASGRQATDTAIGAFGLAIHGSDLYITSENSVRSIDLGTGVTTVVAGVGVDASAGVPGPAELANVPRTAAVAVDGDGNRYVADDAAAVVYKIDVDGDISVFAGEPGSACGDPTGGCGNGGLATNAQLNTPLGLAADGDGNVYIADSADQAIRRVDVGGTITTIVGTGEACADATDACGDGGSGVLAQVNSPIGLAWGNGGLFIADVGDRRVRFWDGADVHTVAGDGGYAGYGGDVSGTAQFDSPVAYARDGEAVYIAQSDGRVRRYQGFTWSPIAGLGTAPDGPAADRGNAVDVSIPNIPPGGMAAVNGRVFVSDPDHHRVRVIGSDFRIGTYAGSGDACVPANGCGDGGLALDADITPGALSVDDSGSLYIADADAHEVRRVSPSGVITRIAGTGTACADPTQPCGDGGDPTAAQLNAPQGITYSDNGEVLFIADTGDRRLRLVTFTGDTPNTILTLAGTGASGDSGDGGDPTDATFTAPVAATVSGTRILVADAGTHRVRGFTLGGSITAYAGDGVAGNTGDGGAATSARLDAPVALGVTDDNKTVIVDRDRNRVRSVDDGGGSVIDNLYGAANGATATFGGDGGPATDAQFALPGAIAWDAAHELLYVADPFNSRVRRVDVGGGGTITTVAGAGSNIQPSVDANGDPAVRFWGDGGPASEAGLALPFGVAVAASGDLYISDRGDNRVRKVAYGSGLISTIAGTGDPTSADASPPASAQFGAIAGVARDDDGAIYVADGNRVRKVAGGATTTIAGTGARPTLGGDDGFASAAQFDAPSAMAQDAFGNTYVADGARIRRIGLDGTISAFAGTGTPGYSGDSNKATQAEISRVGGIAADNGSVFFTDVDNHVVRKVDSGGNISTVVGTGVAGNTGDDGSPTAAELGSPEGIAVKSPGVLDVADSDNAVVREIDFGNDKITTVVGTGVAGFFGDTGAATSAKLDHPTALATNPDGSLLFVVDAGNHRIRRVSGGTIETVAGDGTAGGSGDGGDALSAKLGTIGAIAYSDPDAALYISDTSNNRIRAVDFSGNINRISGSAAGTAGFAGDAGSISNANARFDAPAGILVNTWSSTGIHVVVADSGNRRVRSLAFDGDLLTTSAGTGAAATWAGDGGQAVDAALGNLVAIGVAPDGTIYVGESYEASLRIRRIATNGTITTVSGNDTCADSDSDCGDGPDPLAARYSAIRAFAVTHVVDLDGYTGDVIFISDGHRVRTLLPGVVVAGYAGTAVAGDGTSGDGGAAIEASLDIPVGLAVTGTFGEPDFALYIADVATHRVRVVDDSGDIERFAGNGDSSRSGDGGAATSAGVPAPAVVAVNGAGDVYIAGGGAYDATADWLRKVDHTNGHISTLAGQGDAAYRGDRGGALGAKLTGPSGLVIGDDGALYLAQSSTAGRIRKIVGPQ